MELRSYNVERVWIECVRCRFGNELGVNRTALSQRTEDIKDMLGQLSLTKGLAQMFHYRKDGEMWTPYLQIVEMLLLLGAKIGCVEITGELNPQAQIKIVL